MRTTYSVALMLAILLAGTYWYTSVEAICRLPIYYTLGSVDERFNLTEDETRTILSSAESIWEEATGRNLFTYSDDASLTVNFIFDERQQSAILAEIAKERLDAKENVNEALSDTYAKLVEDYKKQQLLYEDMREGYERKLNSYNAEVKKYNDEGGAPPNVYQELEERRQELDRELVLINSTSKTLNELSGEINKIGERGNNLINEYNKSVHTFNDTYGDSREFTQGDYQGKEINIYTYKDKHELTLVLAHEFGHALSLEHVGNEASVMYYLIGGQPEELVLSQEDIGEFQQVCGDVTTYERFREILITWLKNHGVI